MAGDIEKAHQLLTNRVISKPGVAGTAIGLKDGEPCIKVYVEGSSRKTVGDIPSTFEGFPVVVEGSGPFHRFG